MQVPMCEEMDHNENEDYSTENNIDLSLSTTDNDDTDLNFTNTSINTADIEVFQTSFAIKRDDFDKIICIKTYNRFVKGKKITVSRYKCKPGLWQDIVSNKIWEKTKLQCGFHFKNHYISSDLRNGSMNGKCDCGTKLAISLEITRKCVKFHCKIELGPQKGCGKRYLRQPIRRQVGKELCTMSADRYRATQAQLLMTKGDPEPPIIPKRTVLNNVKKEYNASLNLDKDTVKSLEILKKRDNGAFIQSIGYDPFYVHFCTNCQKDVLKSYAKEDHLCIYIDASGNICTKILKNDEPGGHIFLYICVINCRSGQMSVNQMLSEAHDAGHILHWLVQWIRSGVPMPRETVTDCSRALLTAIVKAFCGYITIEDYADIFLSSNFQTPPCYVRIDVAHFMKTYYNLLKDVPRLVRQFYLGVFGKLITSTDLPSARKIIKSTLLLCQSETKGFLDGCETQKTPCENSFEFLKNIITTSSDISNITENMESSGINTDEVDIDAELPQSDTSKWSIWAQDIINEVELLLQNGTEVSPYFIPCLKKKLLRDIKLLPLWTCVFRDKFGYGRIPASSASVEGEFNRIKTVNFPDRERKKRVDVFVSDFITFLNGQAMLLDAGLQESQTHADVNNNSGESHLQQYSKSLIENDNPTFCDQISVASDILEECMTQDLSNLDISTCSVPDSLINSEANISNVKQVSSSTVFCSTCKNETSNAHKCVQCDKAVHAIDICSLALSHEDEGYGQKRLCLPCSKNRDGIQTIATNEIEDWKGLGTKKNKKRKAKYIFNEEALSHNLQLNRVNIPILKNGSRKDINAVKIEQTSYTVQYTCALDSLIQVLVFAMLEHVKIKELILDKDISIFKIARDIVEKNVRAHTYRLRTQLYLELFKNTDIEKNDYRFQKFGDSVLINAVTDVVHLARNAFQSTPSFVEESICDNGCAPRKTNRVIIGLTNEQVFEENMETSLNDIGTDRITICSNQPKCQALEKKKLLEIGYFLFIEILDIHNIRMTPLEKIRRNVTFQGVKFKLCGIVNHKLQMHTRASQEMQSLIGHYTAFCPTDYGSFTEFDDMKNAPKKVSEKKLIFPELIMYIRED